MVSFHSLEDKIIKDFFKSHAVKNVASSKYSQKIAKQENGILSILTKKPETPSFSETKLNPRSRSAKLRAAVKGIQ